MQLGNGRVTTCHVHTIRTVKGIGPAKALIEVTDDGRRPKGQQPVSYTKRLRHRATDGVCGQRDKLNDALVRKADAKKLLKKPIRRSFYQMN